MSNNREKAKLLAEISLVEIGVSRVIPKDFFPDSTLGDLNNLEAILESISSSGSLQGSFEDHEIERWEKDIIDYCEERDSLLIRVRSHYSLAIQKAQSKLDANEFRRKRLKRDFSLYKVIVANPMAKDKKLLGKLSDINDLSDYTNIGATAVLKGLKAGKEAVFDQVKGDVTDEFLISQGDVIDKGLENFLIYNQAFYTLSAIERNITVRSKEDYIKKGNVIIRERHSLNKYIRRLMTKMTSSEYIGFRSNSYHSYPFH